jgi:beta-glucanase (GH16 family)
MWLERLQNSMKKKKTITIFASVVAIIVIIGTSGIIYYLNTQERPSEDEIIYDNLIWADEFDYEGFPNASKWNFELRDPGWVNNELQQYVKRLNNSRVVNGTLILEARKDNIGGYPYSSVRITTQYKADFKYGRFEARAILPGGRGMWPAIWMMPTLSEYGQWPSSGEIDIMEHVGYAQNFTYGTVHTQSFNHNIGTQKGSQVLVRGCESEFHTYAIEWSPDHIRFFVDDRNYFNFTKQEQYTWKEWPFDRTFYFILNIAVGGDWGGSQGVDDSIFPQQMIVDYVRIYQQSEDTIPPSKVMGVFPTNVSENQVDLIWMSITDFDLDHYNIYRDGVKISEIITSYYSDTGLMAGSTYIYEIAAVDSSGNEGPKSDLLSITTRGSSNDTAGKQILGYPPFAIFVVSSMVAISIGYKKTGKSKEKNKNVRN